MTATMLGSAAARPVSWISVCHGVLVGMTLLVCATDGIADALPVVSQAQLGSSVQPGRIATPTNGIAVRPRGLPPTIKSLEPPIVAPSQILKLTGENLGLIKPQVYFLGQNNPQKQFPAKVGDVHTPTLLDVVTPSSLKAGSYQIVVTTRVGSGAASVTVATMIEGACGSANGIPVTAAPTSGLCSAGTASAVSGTGPWSWSCAGFGGGATASCSAPLASVPSGQTVTSVRLTSTANQTLAPFSFGLGFRKGDVTGTPTLDVPDQQVVVMKRWNDGSVKHAVASGHVNLTAGTAKTIGVINSATPATGTNLTATNIANAHPQASVALGGYGTVNLSDLLASPFRTWISGPEMVEAHYRRGVGNDPSLAVWFHVRLYKNGRLWIRASVENGYLDVTTADKSYVPKVIIGGTTVYDHGGAPLTHYAHTRWTQDAWIGGDPQVTPAHDTAYLKATRLVPNYMAVAPSATVLDNQYQSYAPYQVGQWSEAMGSAGFQDQIGLLPLWDALYVTSGADPRAYRAVVANAKAIGSYPIVWADSATQKPFRPTDRPTWGIDGKDSGGGTTYEAGSASWDIAHHGSAGYLAYLITGDYFFLEDMEDQAALAYLLAGSVDWSVDPAATNYGTSRYFNGQTRGYAWALRTLNQLAGLGPDNDPVVADYQALLANNISHLLAIKNTVSPEGIGYLYEYDQSTYGVGLVAPWMQHFFIQALGMGFDLEPLADMSGFKQVRDYQYRAAVGILGDASGYCFTQASQYNVKSNDGSANTPNSWYKTWSQVYSATFATPPACGNTLAGDSGGAPIAAATGYWGNLLPAIAYAVDHGAPGAAAAWSRLSGASNWSTVIGSGFGDVPNWGIVPRESQSTDPAVNGICGSSDGAMLSSAPTTDLCSTGAASSVTGSGPWNWSCAGSNGGTTANCSAQIVATVVEGACGSANGASFSSAPTSGLCSAGAASSVTGSGPWNWQCVGSNGGATASCSALLTTAKVDGHCGTANGASFPTIPTTNLCATGTASTVAGSGPWSWVCSGSNGGSSASCAAGYSASGIPAAIANLPAGHWLELPNTTLRSVAPEPLPANGHYYFPYLVTAWTGGTVDTVRNRLLVWGGGHDDYWGNELYALDLPTLSIKRIVDPSPDTLLSACTSALPSGAPAARHTYDGLAYLPESDRLFAVDGALSSCGNGDPSTWVFDFPSMTWINRTTTPTSTKYGTMAVYDAATKLVYVKDQSDFFSYNPATNTYAKLNVATQVVDYHLSAAIDSKRRKFVMIGDGLQVIDLRTNTMTTMATTHSPAFMTSQESPGIAYDPVADRIVAWHGGSDVYALNMDTGDWSQVATNAGPLYPAPSQGTFGRWGYVPQYGVFVLINDVDQNAWVFRLAP